MISSHMKITKEPRVTFYDVSIFEGGDKLLQFRKNIQNQNIKIAPSRWHLMKESIFEMFRKLNFKYK